MSDSVQEIMKILLRKEIISSSNVKRLKDIDVPVEDPGLVMSYRHKAINKHSHEISCSESNKKLDKRLENNKFNMQQFFEDQKLLEEEINKFKTNLELNRKQIFDDNKEIINKFTEQNRSLRRKLKQPKIIETKSNEIVKKEDNRVEEKNNQKIITNDKYDSLLSVIDRQLQNIKNQNKKLKERNKQNAVKAKCSKPKSITVTLGNNNEKRYELQKSIIVNQKKKLLEQEKEIEKLRKQQKEKVNIKHELKLEISSKTAVILKKEPSMLACLNQKAEERRKRLETIKVTTSKKLLEQKELIKLKEQQQLLIEEEKRNQILQKRIEDREKRIELEKNRENQEIILCKLRVIFGKITPYIFIKRSFEMWMRHHLEMKSVKYKLNQIFLKCLATKCILQWRDYKCRMIDDKFLKFRELFNKIVLQFYWNIWLQSHKKNVIIKIKIKTLYGKFLKYKCWKLWCYYSNRQQKINVLTELALKTAVDRCTVFVFLKKWKSLPKILYDEREQEQRIRSLKAKVCDVIPDYDDLEI